MSQLPLKALWVFETVARCGSFRFAADELCVSQSAVSHQIKHLEEWFGKPLFDRTGSRPQLLPDGTVLAQELRASFLDIGAACHRARRGSGFHTLVIAAIPSIATCWLIPRLEGFRSRFPDIAISVVYAIHGQKIDFDNVDLAFVFGKRPPEKLCIKTDFFMSGTSVPVASPSLSSRLDRSDIKKAILEAELLHDTDVEGWSSWFMKSGLTTMPEMTGPIFQDFNLLRAAALSGQGVALCPLAVIRRDIHSNRLVPLSPIPANEDCNYYLVHQISREPAVITAIDAFKNWLFDVRDSESDIPEPQEAALYHS